MKRVLLILLFSSLAVALLPHCSEKCPFEPCEPVDGRICGSVELPRGFPMSFKNLRLRTLAGSAALGCDRSFAVPVLEECGAHLVVLATEDTVPVLLGCSLPEPERRKREGAIALASDNELLSIIGSPETGVRLSAASTALALTMLNPLISGGTEEERSWFASAVVAHEGFEDLVDEVSEGLRSSPGAYLNGEALPDLYFKASRIVADVVTGITCGGPGEGWCDDSGLGPYVDDAPGDEIALRNAGFVHYGVRVMDAVADTLRTVLLLNKRRVSMFVQPHPAFDLEYSLGDGCADLHFFKGIVGVDEADLLDPGHPGGLATRANVAQAVWNLLAVFDALPPIENPEEIVIGGTAAVAGFTEVIQSGGPADVILQALECAMRYPDETVHGLLGDAVDPSDFTGFLAAVRPVLERNVTGLVSEGLEDTDRFAHDLIASPDYSAQCVCQAGGELVECPDQPVLSGGGVEPDSGDLFTEFTFLVHYYDRLGDPPDLVRVIVDGDEHDMDLLNGEPSDGVYHYSANLSPGLHTHYFRCADTTGATARFPTLGPAEGPFVAVPLVLTSGYVEPPLGSTMTHFRYTVDCYDADGQVPASVRVFIDGEPCDMQLSSSWGDNHRYKFVTRLPGGTHDYFFRAEDLSGHVVRLPAEGVSDGPFVSQYLPELSNPSVNPPVGIKGDRFTYKVDYFDQDGDAPWFVSVCHDDVCQNMKLRSGTPSNGTYSHSCVLTTIGQHTYYFKCADSTGILVRLPEAGTLSGPYLGRRPGGARNYDAKVAVHVMPYDPHMNCGENLPEIEGCYDIQTTYEGCNFLAFPVFFDLVEYQGVEFGLSWPEWTGSATWHTCADLAIGDISHPGDGISVVWYLCRFDNVAIPGWAWIYAEGPGLVAPCAHPFTGRIKVLNCTEIVDEPFGWAGAGVNGAEGHDPCQHIYPLDAPPVDGWQGAMPPVKGTGRTSGR